MNFDDAFQHLIGIEGKYSNRPTDRGGETMYGVTIMVARRYGYTGPMKDMPLSVAKEIYRGEYWDKLRLDFICAISYPIAYELFDTGVNMGAGYAGKFFQRALNAFNKEGAVFGDIIVDGQIGAVTVDRFRTYAAKFWRLGGESVMLKCLNALQGERYMEIAERDPSQEEYVFGWFNQRVAI